MSDFFSKYGWTIVEVIVSIFSITFLMSVFSNTTIKSMDSMDKLGQSVVVTQVDYEMPTVDIAYFDVTNAILDKDSTFDWKEYVKITDSKSKDVLTYLVDEGVADPTNPNKITYNKIITLEISGDVDTSTPGEYKVAFKLKHYGQYFEKQATFFVREDLPSE